MHLPEMLSDEHYQKLYRLQDEILAYIEGLGPVFYLGGGTALSRFYYNHRYSDDLDFFTFEDIDFIQSVQELHQKLEEEGFRVSTYGFSQTFARFSLEEPRKYPNFPLKCDFIATRKGSHIGDYKKSPIYSRIDNPRNILAEKLSFIYQKSPKNIADIWTICSHLSFNWEEVIGQANRKRTTDPLLAAETLKAFPAADLEKVHWINPINVEHFERDRDIMVQNIVTKEDNQLVKRKGAR
jgi:predicted nucleotidyltransferase component of viral defense system